MVRGQTWYVCDTTPSRDGAFCGCCHDTFCARFPPLNGLYTSRPSSSFRPSIDFDYYYRAAIPTALFQFLPYPRRRRYTLERPPLLPSICLQYLIEIPFPPVPSLSNLDYFRFDSVPSTVSLSDDRCHFLFTSSSKRIHFHSSLFLPIFIAAFTYGQFDRMYVSKSIYNYNFEEKLWSTRSVNEKIYREGGVLFVNI